MIKYWKHLRQDVSNILLSDPRWLLLCLVFSSWDEDYLFFSNCYAPYLSFFFLLQTYRSCFSLQCWCSHHVVCCCAAASKLQGDMKAENRWRLNVVYLQNEDFRNSVKIEKEREREKVKMCLGWKMQPLLNLRARRWASFSFFRGIYQNYWVRTGVESFKSTLKEVRPAQRCCYFLPLSISGFIFTN